MLCSCLSAARPCLTLAVVILLSLSVGCSSDPVDPRPEPVASVIVTPAEATIEVGETTPLTARPENAAGGALQRAVTWKSSNPAVATVDATGLVAAVAAGTATIVATSEGMSGTAAIEVPLPVVSVTIEPESVELRVGETLTLTAVPRDGKGEQVARRVAWTSDNDAIATVSDDGLVTGVSPGSATIEATCGRAAGSVEITVKPRGTSIVIDDPGPGPLVVGATVALKATVYDANGVAMPGYPVSWSSGNPSVATVDGTGLVTGTAPGTATITASVGSPAVASASVTIQVVDQGHGGNNLSHPAVFAEGIGLTGLPVSQDAGLRPTAAEGIVVTGLPFFHSGNTPDYGAYYRQQGANVWQAEWEDGAAGPPEPAEVAWGDTLTRHTFDTHTAIRIEVSLTAYARAPLTGYRMVPLYGSGGTEMQGTDGSTVVAAPMISSVMPRLTIEKLDPDTREPVFTVFDGAIHEGLGGAGRFVAEVNVAGKIVYAFTLLVRDSGVPKTIHRYGWYRFTVRLDQTATIGGAPVNRNLTLSRLAAPGAGGAPVYVPQIDPANNVTWLDVYIVSASGGEG